MPGTTNEQVFVYTVGRNTPEALEKASAYLGSLPIDPACQGTARNLRAAVSCSSAPLSAGARFPCGCQPLLFWNDDIMLRWR